MDIKRKLEIVEQAIRSISDHRDEDAAVRQTAMERIRELVAGEQDRIATDVQDQIARSLG